jgi:hypothetical protein
MDHVTDSPAAASPTGKSGKSLLVAGYLTAFFLPFLGLILGALILIRRRTRHGQP